MLELFSSCLKRFDGVFTKEKSVLRLEATHVVVFEICSAFEMEQS